MLEVAAPNQLRGTRFEIGDAARTIGREGDFVVEANGVSRVHARVWRENGASWIADCGSTNGTIVNRRAIGENVRLQVGDVVELGELTLRVEDELARERRPPVSRRAREIGPSETTRYLCAATELDDKFRERILSKVVEQPYRAIGNSYGVDLTAVARHAIAARRRRSIRDLALLAVLAVFVATVAWAVIARAGDRSVGALLSAAWPAVLPLGVAWLVVAADHWYRLARALPRFVVRRFDPDAVQPRVSARLAQRLQVLAEAGAGNVTVFSGFNPFVGSGVSVDSWSFAIDVTKGRHDAETGERQAPKPFDAADVHTHVMGALRELGLPGLRVSERLFVDGFDVNFDERLLPDRFAPPVSAVGPSVARESLHDPESPMRTYMCLEAVGWHGHLVVTMFVRAVRLPGSLFMEGISFVLLPLKREYYRIDSIRPRSTLEAAAAALARALADFLPQLAASPARVAAWASRARRSRRTWKAQRWSIGHGKVFDYGAATTVREEAMGDDRAWYFLMLDQQMYVKVAQERLLDSIGGFLHDHWIDTAEFGAQQTVINQNRTVNVGHVGDKYSMGNISGSGFAIGSQAVGTAQSGPRARPAAG